MPLDEFLPVQAPETAGPSCFLYRLKQEVRMHRWSCQQGYENLGRKKKVRMAALNQTKYPFRPASPAGADSTSLGKSRIGQAYSSIPPFCCPSLQGFIAQGLPNPGVVSLCLKK